MQEDNLPQSGETKTQSENSGQRWSIVPGSSANDLATMLRIAADMGAKINATLDLDTIFDTVIPFVEKSFGLYHIFIFLLDENLEHLYLKSGYGQVSKELILEHYTIPLNHPHSLIAKSARKKKVVVANNVLEDDDYLMHPKLPDVYSEAAFPMVAGGTCIGVFDVQHNGQSYFTDDIVHIFMNLSGQIATAVQNARYVTQIKQSLVETQYQVKIDSELAPARTMDEILDVVMVQVEALFHSPAYLLMPDPHTPNLTYTVVRANEQPGHAVDKKFHLGIRIPADDFKVDHLFTGAIPYVSPVVNTGDPSGLICHRWLSDTSFHSFMIAQLKSQDVVLGYLLTFTAEPGLFDATKLKMTSTLLERCTEMYVKARLEEDLELALFTIDHAPAAILWIRPDGTFYSANDTACQLLGYTQKEFRDLSHIARLDPNMIPSVWRTHWRKVLTDHRFTIETEYRAKLGQLIPVEVTTNYLQFGEQEFNCVFVRDITERKRAQNTRDQFTMQLHTSAKISEQVGAILDPDILLETVIPLLKEQFDLYHAHVYILEKEFLVLRAGYGRPGQIMVQQGHKIAYHHPRSLVARAARTREAVMVNDVSAVQDHMPNILLPRTQSEVAVPIIFRDQVLGVFDVQSDRLNNFTDLDLDAYRILAGQLANALYSATLFEQQKRTASELRTKAETVRVIFNAMTEGILVTDMMGNITDLNAAAMVLFGFEKPEMLLNQNITALITRPSLTRMAENLRSAMDNGTRLEVTKYSMIRKDGEVFDAEQSAALLKDADNAPIGIVSITRDITEQIRINRDILRFRALAENAVDAIVMADLSGHIDYANRACYELFGYDKSENDMLGKLLFSLWLDTAMPLLLAEVLPTAGENGWQGEVLQVRKDKSTFAASLTCFSVKSEAGQTLSLAMIVRDITARKKAEEDLLRFAVQLSTAARVSTQVNAILDPTQLLEEVVPLVHNRFNVYHVHVYTFDEMRENLVMRVGSGEAGRLMRENRHQIPVNLPHSLVAKAARMQETILVDDVIKEVDFFPNALLPDTRSELAIPMIVAGEVIGVFDVQDNVPYRFSPTDVDVFSTLAAQTATSFRNARSFEEIQIAAKRLREVDRLKSEFLGNMSHELRTPLNSILGYAEVILMGIDGELPDMMKEDVEAIYDNGQQLLSLINDILDLTKIEAGQMSLNFQSVDVVPLLEGSKTNNMGLLLKRKVPVEIGIVIANNLPPIRADRIRIAQVLNNLVSNAIKFTDQGSITLTARYDGASDRVHIEVKDTGVGIASEDVPNLFERFRQVDGSSTRRAEGSGLGLAISRHLVELHEGELLVKSQPNQGSTFTVIIPAIKA